MSNRKQIGQIGEDAGARYLENRGYKILERNWQDKHRQGEIDIVAKKKNKIIFVEIKTLVGQNQVFLPEDEINQNKKKQLVKMTQIYLRANNISFETPHQIDILAVELNPISGEPAIRHLENTLGDKN